MSEHRFDGRVAIVTGAGRGIGRAHAHLLGARGARVVVNDIGGSTEGDGSDGAVAASVVDEITAAGGEALADASDASTVAGAQTLIDSTVAHFGRVDIVVNNAGIVRWAGFPEADEDNLARHLAVHVGASFSTTRAAWPHFVEQGYGRVVMTTSTGVFGLPDNVGYATAKAAVIGMTRSLATAGAPHGVRVNAIAPVAFTRMAGHPSDDADTSARNAAGAAFMKPELVAPMAAYLAHEACPVTGEVYEAGAGRFARIFLASTPGYVQANSAATIEDVAREWAAINDESGYVVPADLPAWSAALMRRLRPA